MTHEPRLPAAVNKGDFAGGSTVITVIGGLINARYRCPLREIMTRELYVKRFVDEDHAETFALTSETTSLDLSTNDLLPSSAGITKRIFLAENSFQKEIHD